MAAPSANVLSICSGVGGLDLGFKLAVPEARVVCCIEREAYAAAVLAARMADGSLDGAPIWSDLATFDGRPWRGVVDIVTAGFPCTPWSLAGQRRKTADERWLWGDVARAIRDAEPRWVFLENVPALVHGGIEHVLRDLAGCGFDAEWDVFSAAQVGAPHLRERLFILGHRNSIAGKGQARSAVGRCNVADSDSQRCSRCGATVARSRPGTGGDALADADTGGRRAGQRNPQARESDVTGLFPPGPNDSERWAEALQLYPRLEPAVYRVADGPANRLDRLRATGNGVVPVVAAIAFLRLRDRLMDSSCQ